MDGSLPLITAHAWHARLRGAEEPVHKLAWPYRVARFINTPLDLEQPALMDDVICLHLGGAKKVKRCYAGRSVSYDVPDNALTLMPRWQENRWATEGPNEYAHLIVSPRSLDELAISEFGRGRGEFELYDDVGFTHHLAERLAHELIFLYDSVEEGRLYREGVFTAFVLTLLRSYSSLGGHPKSRSGRAPDSLGGLPSWRLRKVIDFLHSHHTQDVGYGELVELAGVSRSHFFRAFKTSTGMTPGRYLEQLRVSLARAALEKRKSTDEAACEGGFENSRSMSRAFLRRFGVTPSEYRRWYG